MQAHELLQRIVRAGGDEYGIRDRFGENDELYAQCVAEFLREPHFNLLRQAVGDKNIEQAFDSAHALKGLSANLGLTALYEAIYPLVESLRAASLTNVDRQYAQVLARLGELEALLSDAPADTPAVDTPAPTRK